MMVITKASVLFLLLSSLCGVAYGDDPVPLNFALITSFGEFGFNSSAGIPAIDLALEHINERQVIPGYKLQYTGVKDSKVSFAVRCCCS